MVCNLWYVAMEYTTYIIIFIYFNSSWMFQTIWSIFTFSFFFPQPILIKIHLLCTNLCIHLLNPSLGHACEVSWRLIYCPWTPKSCCRFVLVEKSKQMHCNFILWACWVTIFILTYSHHVIKDVFDASKNHSPSLFLHMSHVLGETCNHDNNRDFLPFCCCYFKLISNINIVQWNDILIPLSFQEHQF
jgi:hypothetical protein